MHKRNSCMSLTLPHPHRSMAPFSSRCCHQRQGSGGFKQARNNPALPADRRRTAAHHGVIDNTRSQIICALHRGCLKESKV